MHNSIALCNKVHERGQHVPPYVDAPMIWIGERCLVNTACSFITLLISLFYQQQKMICVQPLHHSFFLLMPFSLFPFLFLSVSVSLFLCLFMFLSLSLSHSLSPQQVCSRRLTLTCSPVNPQICCSNQLSSPLKQGHDTPRQWTERAKSQTISSREGKTTHKPKNTKTTRSL